jgi:hypothetical protein
MFGCLLGLGYEATSYGFCPGFFQPLPLAFRQRADAAEHGHLLVLVIPQRFFSGE